MLPDAHVRWCATSDDALVWREWDGDVVVFNQDTGSTHLLGELGGEIFRRLVLAEHGVTVEALAVGLAGGEAEAADARLTGSVAEVLSSFARLGLAQPDES